LTWEPTNDTEPLDLDLTALFAELWGDDRSVH